MLVAENPSAPAILFVTEDICSMAPFPKSLCGNFFRRNARCRNKEIIVPYLLMRLHGTGFVRYFFYGLYCFSIILIYIHLHFVICDKSTKLMLSVQISLSFPLPFKIIFLLR